ncbi:MAG TPA: hypothetical protein VIH28_06900 [Ignavibacteriaceae bacterium]
METKTKQKNSKKYKKALDKIIPTCHNSACGKPVKSGRNLYCCWDCYIIDNKKHKPETPAEDKFNNNLTPSKKVTQSEKKENKTMTNRKFIGRSDIKTKGEEKLKKQIAGFSV